jgi:hypothetical protein
VVAVAVVSRRLPAVVAAVAVSHPLPEEVVEMVLLHRQAFLNQEPRF